MKPVDTLYCIADEAGFRLLRGRGTEMEEIRAASSTDFDDVGYEFASNGRNRAGRGDISFGHAKTSRAEVERPRLAKHVIDALKTEWDKAGCTRIVLAAGPKMLGALRGAMPGALAAHVTDLAKDLSDVPAHELYQHLQGVAQA